MTKDELIEQLADKEHASWARWMAYLFSKCDDWYETDLEGQEVLSGKIIPIELAERWQRQIDTPYADLSEQEKQSDRDEVAHILPIIDEYAQSPLHGDINANLELFKWRIDALKECIRVLELQLDGLCRMQKRTN